MKSIKTIFATAVLAATMLFAVSCKKDSPAPTQSTQEKILGVWKLQNVVDNDHYSGSDHINTYPGNPGDYYDFRNDGKIYGYLLGNYDTTAYGIVNDNQVWIDVQTDIYDIKTLTTSAMQLYIKTVYSPTEFNESTANFAR